MHNTCFKYFIMILCVCRFIVWKQWVAKIKYVVHCHRPCKDYANKSNKNLLMSNCVYSTNNNILTKSYLVLIMHFHILPISAYVYVLALPQHQTAPALQMLFYTSHRYPYYHNIHLVFCKICWVQHHLI